MGDVREALTIALYARGLERGTAGRLARSLAPDVDRLLALARAEALRDAAEHLPEVGDVLRGMAAREVGDE